MAKQERRGGSGVQKWHKGMGEAAGWLMNSKQDSSGRIRW